MAFRRFYLLCCVSALCLSSTDAQEECQFSADNYEVKWSFNADDQRVYFDLTTSQPLNTPNFWTAVAFGPGMFDLDAAVIRVQNGVVTMTDENALAYGPPSRDLSQDVELLSSAIENGRLRARFARPLISADDKGLEECQVFQFPVSGGALANAGGVLKHTSPPITRQFCNVKLCPPADATTTTAAATETPSVSTDCSYSTSNYALSWYYDGQNLNFDLTAQPLTPLNEFWSGVGIGESMDNLDVILVLVDGSGGVRVGDYFARGRGPPSLDAQQNVAVGMTSVTNGRVRASFSRALTTADASDNPMTACFALQLPTSGGPLSQGQFVGKHFTTPERLSLCDVATSCARAAPPAASPTPTQPPPQPPTAATTPQPPPPPPDVTPAATSPCPFGQADLVVCQSYFDDYFGQVDQWTVLHGLPAQSQYSRACSLVGAVPGVQRLCCQRFQEQCAQFQP